MSKINIRAAKQEDCPRLMELVQELAVYEKEPDAVTVSMQHFVESGFGDQPVWWAIVAELDGVIVGFALYYIRYSTWKGRRLYLEDLIVTEEHRGKGLGKMLLDELVSIAQKGNFSGMMWQVLDWNEPAINFYKKYNASIEDGWLNVNLDF